MDIEKLIWALTDANGGEKPFEIVLPPKVYSDPPVSVLGVLIRSSGHDNISVVSFRWQTFFPMTAWGHDGKSSPDHRGDVEFQGKARAQRDEKTGSLLADWIKKQIPKAA